MEELQEQIQLPLVSRPYSIPPQELAEGYRLFWKRFARTGTLIRAGIMLFCLIDFLVVAICRFVKGQETNTVVYVLILLCAAVLFLLWYNPRKARRNVLEAAKEMEHDQFEATLSEQELTIRSLPPKGEEDAEQEGDMPPETVLPYSTLIVTEREAGFVLFEGKSRAFVLPKSAFSPEQLPVVRRLLLG